MSQVTITLNGKSVTVPRAVAESQIAKAEAAIAAMQPIREQTCNRHSSDAECAKAQVEQDARRAQYQALIASCRAALEA
ncbi:MAG TPA: hypothetical protein PKA84_01410 [Rubrivivax sp.]|nr:hypothetical protein [Rubrivivax sp.]HMR68867.1 hypothetical protein [Rubrivivax sp.]